MPSPKIERLDPRLDSLIAADAEIEILASGFDWSEGPVWIPSGSGWLLFSDVPQNRIYKWQPGREVEVFLEPSGYTGDVPRGGEPGSNGLTLDAQGRLVLCQHGDRAVARLEPSGELTTLAADYQGKRFNSPNDLVYKSDGSLYFTDPPYGLEQGEQDPARHLDFQGVFRLDPDGSVTLLTSDLSRPNGLAFSPDESVLYVANSDPQRAVWMAFPMQEGNTLGQGEVFFDATAWVGEKPGLPDGLKVDREGNLFATGPGGVLIFSSDGTHLGTIDTGQATANCAWGGDGSDLYITADGDLMRVRTLTRGANF